MSPVQSHREGPCPTRGTRNSHQRIAPELTSWWAASRWRKAGPFCKISGSWSNTNTSFLNFSLLIGKTGVERSKAGGEGDDRGWDGWAASPTQWTWVWSSSGRWWRPGEPGVLQSMGLQRVGHNWETEQQQNWCWWRTAKKGKRSKRWCLPPISSLEFARSRAVMFRTVVLDSATSVSPGLLLERLNLEPHSRPAAQTAF